MYPRANLVTTAPLWARRGCVTHPRRGCARTPWPGWELHRPVIVSICLASAPHTRGDHFWDLES